jgi:rod shape-determining protein MreC
MTEGRWNALLLALLLFAQLLLMAGSIRGEEGSTVLEGGLSRASRPVVGAARQMGGALGGGVGFFQEMARARRENLSLRAENERLRAELDHAREEVAELPRLRRLLEMREALAPRSVGATVVASRVGGQAHTLVIAAGTDRGVRPDLPVVGWGGVVGRVVSATPDYAKVRLLTDPNSGVAGIVQRSRAEGMILGRGVELLDMAYVPQYADVLVGDRVVTSGLDGVFPKGYGIGTVVEVGPGVGASKSIQVRPDVGAQSLEEVLVLLDLQGTELLERGAEEGVR